MAKTNEKDASLQESLTTIQSKLKAPKNQYNSFGKYKYRSAEDILEAVKPLLLEHGVVLNMTDEVVLIGTRYYIKSTARVIKGEEYITAEGFAREDETKKGMDGAQVTGTSSSYARKYALNGLFCIDDTKDADTDAKPVPQPAKPAVQAEIDFEQEMLAESEANMAKTSAELTEIWNKWTKKNPAYRKQDGVFFKAVKNRGAQLKAENK